MSGGRAFPFRPCGSGKRRRGCYPVNRLQGRGILPHRSGLVTGSISPVWNWNRPRFPLPAAGGGGDARYRSYKLGKGGIWYLDLATGEEKPLIVDEHDNRYSAVSPDGRYLAFVSTGGITPDKRKLPQDRAALFVYDLKTGRRRLVAGKSTVTARRRFGARTGKNWSFSAFAGTARRCG